MTAWSQRDDSSRVPKDRASPLESPLNSLIDNGGHEISNTMDGTGLQEGADSTYRGTVIMATIVANTDPEQA
ncbi:hypothetical protein E4U15_007238 [Claviceps sp. LM218 group G6]|nr:hypothetical protein E4U15_007238 [Claviceps sp. LM218 group G6]